MGRKMADKGVSVFLGTLTRHIQNSSTTIESLFPLKYIDSCLDNISSGNNSSIRTFGSTRTMANKIQAVIIDLSGTIHIEDSAIPGAQDALKRLRDSELKVKFVTNTTKEPLRTLYERLQKLKFDLEAQEIFTSLTAARSIVEAMNVRPYLMLEESAKEDFEGICTDNPNAIVVGLAPDHFNYAPMNTAFKLLLDGASLIAIHKGRYFKKNDGLYLGPGPFVTGLEYATDAKALVVGKPEKTFFIEAIKSLDVDPANTIMIGDDARDDVGGAVDAGMQGILVKTGKYRPGDDEKILSSAGDNGRIHVCDDFPAAVDLILSKLR